MKDVALLLVHGYPFDHTLWFSTIAALGAQARVICPDLPGFGREPVLKAEPSLDGFADWLLELLNEHKIESVAVAGMSMGGYIALAFAEKYPERLAGLGLISTQTLPDTSEARDNRMKLVARIEAEGIAPAVEAILPKMFAPSRGKDENLLQYPRNGAEKAGVQGLTWALRAMAKRPDRTALVKNLKVPVLVLHGSEDKIVPSHRSRELAESCKIPILMELDGVGHASPLEAPDHVAQGLARLMEKVRQARAS